MTFQESVRVCFSKYADFSGRASRSEYWWFFLFIVLVGTATSFVSDYVSAIFLLGTLLPSLAAATRRLHDTQRSGWWQLAGPLGGVDRRHGRVRHRGDAAAPLHQDPAGQPTAVPCDVQLLRVLTRVRAERLPIVIVSAAGCAVAALMFLLVLTGRLAYRGEKGEVAA